MSPVERTEKSTRQRLGKAWSTQQEEQQEGLRLDFILPQVGAAFLDPLRRDSSRPESLLPATYHG